ncbi:hypothetical protein AYL99_00406 [Fonsecaea erecta]|uniref:Uncharacterized protein n=1 Tax=Fonsecaea erecta TaxID=1367422 RepID=A0A178ZXB9_9EURO|nr:hypothetical protein AYL99_00406 [Fonsecaea erecta]OAP64434.1 hypothetical protein AYL99_00406 [Fonsecaea erecta]
MAPHQQYLWVSVDSKGRVGRSDGQSSNIKSHCAQYYHQVNRHKVQHVMVDLAVPEATPSESPRQSPVPSISSGEEPEVGDAPNRQTLISRSAGKLSQQSRGQIEQRVRRRKPQEWRRVRCHRFRKQSGERPPKPHPFDIRQEDLPYLAMESDFDADVGDPLTRCVKLTVFYSRAAFMSTSSCQSMSVSHEASPVQHALYFYKLSAIQMIRIRLSENPQSPDQTIFLGIVSLAGCEFMANNPEEGRLHLEACLEIAHARGGLCTLSNPELELMCLAEFEMAALSGNIPCAPLRDMEAAVYSKISKDPTGRWATSDLARLAFLCTEEASQTCKGLACLLQATDGLNSSMASKTQAQIQDNLVLRRLFAGFLLCSVQPLTTQLPVTVEMSLHESLRIAGLLVVAATSLKNMPKGHLLERLTADLALHLQLIPLPLYRSPAVASTMLWIYFVGADGSLFFLRGIAQLARMLGFENWKEVREQLKRFPYVGDEFDSPFEEIWNSAILWSNLPT